jgi:DNA-binding response OmpR family regulator
VSAGSKGKSPNRRTGPILIIEDDLNILDAVAEILELEGYKVERATNGAEGLAVLERVRPALILLDMRMPVLNGWDFANALDKRGLKVPTLVMTAAQDARKWAQEIGAEGYIAKPFHIADLLDAIEALLDKEAGGGGSKSLM